MQIIIPIIIIALVIVAIGYVLIGVLYVLAGIYATLLFFGINLFILLDSLFFTDKNLQPFVIWPIYGLIFGISVGLIIAGRKKKVKYLKPVGIMIPIVLIVLLATGRPGKNVPDLVKQKNNPEPITEKPSYTTGIVIPGVGVNVRSGPSTDYSSIGTLKHGDSVDILSKESAWYKVQFVNNGKNRVGYICDSLLKINIEYGDSEHTEDNLAIEKSPSPAITTEQVPVVIESIPEGASVCFSGEEKGKTPLNINLNSGYTTILLKYPGYNDYKERILIHANGKTNFKFNLDFKYNLTGSWSGIFSDKTMTMVIESFDGTTVKGYDKVKWNDSSEPQKFHFQGTFDLNSGSIELEEQGESFGIGKFAGKVTSDGNSMRGTWTRIKKPIQTYNWSVRR